MRKDCTDCRGELSAQRPRLPAGSDRAIPTPTPRKAPDHPQQRPITGRNTNAKTAGIDTAHRLAWPIRDSPHTQPQSCSFDHKPALKIEPTATASNVICRYLAASDQGAERGHPERPWHPPLRQGLRGSASENAQGLREFGRDNSAGHRPKRLLLPLLFPGALMSGKKLSDKGTSQQP
jgi:hypothetical protein